MNDLISVIVPIYNGEAYIPRMIESLLAQTYTTFEVLFVEDHSTDHSKKLLEDVCERDHRFIILSPKEKMGTAVRGQVFALPFCTGSYHFYMSQDDFIDDDFFEKCINKFADSEVDVVIPNCILFDNGKKSKLGEYPLNNDYSLPIVSKKAFILSLDWKIHGFTMEKMKLFKQVGIDARYYNSDEYYKRILFLQATKIVFVDTNFYYRQDNKDAITKGIKYMHIDILATNLLLYKKLVEIGTEKSVYKKRLKELNKEYLKWVLRGIKYELYFQNKGYFLKSVLRLFVLLQKENMRCMFRR